MPPLRGWRDRICAGGRVWLSLPVRLEARKAMSETRPIVPEDTDGTEKNKNGTGAKRKIRIPRLRGNRNNPNFAELGRPCENSDGCFSRVER